MTDLRELYQEVIIDHNRNPRNHHAMDCPTNCANGFNPLCGDKLTVYMQIADNVIQDISFVGNGCAISQASASLMTDALKGQTIAVARDIFKKFHNMVTGDGSNVTLEIDKLNVLAGVCEFPARVKCATLAWHTMDAALANNSDTVVTE